MYHGSARQHIFVRVAMMWIACCVMAAFYFAFGGYLELTVVWGTMALCLSPCVWLYLGLLELRQLCQAQLDQIDTFRHRVLELETRATPQTSENSDARLSRSAAIPPSANSHIPTETEPNAPREVKLPTARAKPAVATVILPSRSAVAAARTPNGHSRKPEANGAGHGASDPDENRTVSQLRRDFADSVRSGRFAVALRVGDEMVARFPDSRSAREFQALRNHLVRRIAEEQFEPVTV